MTLNCKDFKICILGLGYVGLPLAARFSKKGFDIVGFDINQVRVKELQSLNDKNDDIPISNLKILKKKSKLTSNISDIKDSNIFIVTVPTPINKNNTPDLKPIISVSELIGPLIKKGSIIIYESTVYPGVTDEICTPILEKKSNLIFNQDFATGYSPERIVPGDKVNTIEKIKKVVSASNSEALKIVSYLYSSIIDAGIHIAPSIKVAEASKVTENIQRDVNIALINELHQLYSALNINTNDVIEAASTKWNFMKLTPGLVGGHCISIDPYYLMHKSEMTGYTPNLMRTAREINNDMGNWVLDNFLKFCKKRKIDLKLTEVTILGYTFKEDCGDTRNTKVKDLIISMKEIGLKIALWDPYIELEEQHELRIMGVTVHEVAPKNIQIAFLCVHHKEIKNYLNNFDGLIYDFKKITL